MHCLVQNIHNTVAMLTLFFLSLDCGYMRNSMRKFNMHTILQKYPHTVDEYVHFFILHVHIARSIKMNFERKNYSSLFQNL
jgi:hypothetical protein